MFNTIVSAVFLFFALVVLLVGILGSRKRHWVSSAIRLFFVIVSAFVSAILSTIISKAVASPIYSFIVEKIDNPQIEGILADVPSAKAIFCVLVALILTIPIFILLFAIVRTVANLAFNKLLTKCFLKLLKKDTNEEYKKRFEPLSMLFSALASFLVYIVVLIPIVGSLDLAASVAKVSTSDETVIEIVSAATDNVGSKTVRALGGKGIYNFLTRYEVNGERISMAEESQFISTLGQSIFALQDEEKNSEQTADAFRKAGNSLKKTTIVPTLASDFVNAAGDDWLNGKDFHGIACPSLGEEFDPIITSFLECTKGSTCATMREDLKTLVNIIAIFMEKGPSTSSDDLLVSVLSNEELISEISVEILNNPRLSPMMGAIMNMSLEMIGDALELPETSDEAYDEFINDVIAGYRATVAGEANGETVDALSNEITKVFNEYGIELTDGVDTCIATSMLCQFGDGSQMTPEAVKKFFSSTSAVAPMSTSDTLDVATIADKISSLYTQGDDEEALTEKIAAMLTEIRPFASEDAEEIALLLAQKTIAALESDKLDASASQFADANDFVTKNNIIIQENLKAVSGVSLNPEEEAKSVAAIMSSLTTIINDLSSGSADTGTLIKDLGPLLDRMSESNLIGKENANNVLVAIVQSDIVRSSINIPLNQATEMALSINSSISEASNYENQLSSLSYTVTMLQDASEGKNSIENISALLADITPESAESIKALLSGSTIKNYGVSEDSADSVSELVSGIVDNMAVAKDNGMSEDTYQKEAEAVNDMMNIAMSAINSSGTDSFATVTGITITDYVNRALDSEIISTSLVDYVYSGGDTPATNPLNAEFVLNDSEKDELSTALSAKMKEQLSSGSESEIKEYKKTIISITAMVNLDVYIDASGNVTVQ